MGEQPDHKANPLTEIGVSGHRGFSGHRRPAPSQTGRVAPPVADVRQPHATWTMTAYTLMLLLRARMTRSRLLCHVCVPRRTTNTLVSLHSPNCTSVISIVFFFFCEQTLCFMVCRTCDLGTMQYALYAMASRGSSFAGMRSGRRAALRTHERAHVVVETPASCACADHASALRAVCETGSGCAVALSSSQKRCVGLWTRQTPVLPCITAPPP